ncbi:MAG: hypothetical protein ABIP11_03240 [Luteimonas sp.]
MTWLRKIVAELFGLFVDDGSFAIAILVWLGVLWLALPHLPINNTWRAIILFAGLAIILVESVLRRARQRQT